MFFSNGINLKSSMNYFTTACSFTITPFSTICASFLIIKHTVAETIIVNYRRSYRIIKYGSNRPQLLELQFIIDLS